jgi:hypothetical protein
MILANIRGGKMKTVYVVVLLPALATGCASITGSDVQSIMVTTKDKSGALVQKAECTLQGVKGMWKVTTPGLVLVARSAEDIQVECQKEGTPVGLGKLISRAHGAMFGNIIFGGGIGAIIDHSRGTGYGYPNQVSIVMGDTVMIDRRDEVDAERRKEEEIQTKRMQQPETKKAQ